MNKEILNNPARLERFLKLGEECGEIQQALSKACIFGLDDMYGDTGESKLDKLVQEIADLHVVVELLVARGDINPEKLEIAKAAKRYNLFNHMTHEVSNDCLIKMAEDMANWEDIQQLMDRSICPNTQHSLDTIMKAKRRNEQSKNEEYEL